MGFVEGGRDLSDHVLPMRSFGVLDLDIQGCLRGVVD